MMAQTSVVIDEVCDRRDWDRAIIALSDDLEAAQELYDILLAQHREAVALHGVYSPDSDSELCRVRADVTHLRYRLHALLEQQSC
jgi:hypothetical protein